MQSEFSVGQLVRVCKMAGRLCEVVRVLPVTEEGRHLYLIRSEQGAELIVRHHELRRA
jgi:negative regulator of sigma E activity